MKRKWLAMLLALFVGCSGVAFVSCADEHLGQGSGGVSESGVSNSNESESDTFESGSNEDLEETDVDLFTFTLLSNDSYELTKYNGEESVVVIPATYENKPVTTIGEGAFSKCYNLTRVVIPNSVISMGNDAFFSCINLSKIGIGSSLAIIGEYALSDCPLSEIVVDDNNAVYKVVHGNLYTKDGKTLVQYAIGKSNSSFVIPDRVATIADNAFRGAKNLTEIVIPDSVTTIGSAAFYCCYNLTKVTIPDSVTAIRSGTYGLFESCSGLVNVNIGNGVTSIGDSTFSGCRNLSCVTIGAVVNFIATGAFWDCTSLTEIIVNEQNTHYKSVDGNLYTKDGKTLLQYATGKSTAVFAIPDDVTKIGGGAFKSCKNLTEVLIPASVATICEEAFFFCDGLTKIVIPATVETVEFSAFRGCGNLHIYCEVERAPYGWDSNWNYSNNSSVTWGYMGE